MKIFRRFLGVNGKQEAATMIQSRFRGFKARSKNPRIEKLRAAAKSIQEAWRLNRIRVAAIQKIRKYEAKVWDRSTSQIYFSDQVKIIF